MIVMTAPSILRKTSAGQRRAARSPAADNAKIAGLAGGSNPSPQPSLTGRGGPAAAVGTAFPLPWGEGQGEGLQPSKRHPSRDPGSRLAWPGRRSANPFAAVTRVALVAVAAFSIALCWASLSDAKASSCEEAAQLSVLASPIAPWRGAPLRVLFSAEKPIEGELSLISPDGRVAAASRERRGGPPYFWFAEVASPSAGTWLARLATRSGAPADCATITHDIAVSERQPPSPQRGENGVWPIRNAWGRATENLYSAWIETLFDAPLDAAPSWPALHDVLRDRSRNILFNHLGLREDQTGLAMRPDCADLPYFLRAYFSFKMGLPFGYSKCSRGGGGQPPRCRDWWNVVNQEPPPPPPPEENPPLPDPRAATPGSLLSTFGQPALPQMSAPPKRAARPVSRTPVPKNLGLAAAFGHYLPIVADAVHSGSGRTAANDDSTDYYPVSLSQATLRPGAIYADPYGHVLMLVKRVPQTDGAAGVFFAVDGQPDATVARKRFWRGNFLFAQGPAFGGPGFKRFRPIELRNGVLRRETNAEIAKNPHYGDFSLAQSRLNAEDFYDRMDDVMSPEPLDPARALKEVIASLEEQVKARVTSVENGRKFQNSGKGDAEMPEGPAIFEAAGAWEDFATPARDLRILIAIDVALGFPDRVARRPERYAMPSGKSPADVKDELESLLASELASRKFSYPRSDGSNWTLALRDVAERAPALEMAYNVNDCVELRWGAAEGSEEASTCKRHAPGGQRAKMAEHRAWFHERRRPPRG